MKALLLACALLAAAPAGAVLEDHVDLTAGRYSIKVSGMLCGACARAIAEELSRLPAVGQTKVDFESSEILLSVKSEQVLTYAQLRRALRKASKRANLGVEFEAEAIRYRP